MSILSNGYFLAYGEGSLAQGLYYEGDKQQWKDADVPPRPDHTYIYSPNPDRPTFSDWLFDGHDADGSFWYLPDPE